MILMNGLTFICKDKFTHFFGVTLVSFILIRPPLSKKSFPVSRVGKKKASREVGNPFFFFYKLECTGGGGGVEKKN